MADLWQWDNQEQYDEWIEKLTTLIPEGDEAVHSNPEAAVESIILACFTEYRHQLDAGVLVTEAAIEELIKSVGSRDRDYLNVVLDADEIRERFAAKLGGERG